MTNRKSRKKAEDIALQRLQLLTPLITNPLDAAANLQQRAAICEQTGLSDRTVRRYLAAYRNNGFEGLHPKRRTSADRDSVISPDVLQEAVLLRREVPKRSIAQLIQILEWEGRVAKGVLKRSTLQEKLMERGYSSRHMKLYAQSGTAVRRFARKHRNQLWHSDIKFGPYLPIGPGGKKEQVHLVTFLDDATRMVLHGEFYKTLDQRIVEDCFRKAIDKHGVPERVYFDNGKQYRNHWMERTCAKLDIRLLYAKPYSPEATGKIERFNQVVDSFLREAVLEKSLTLDDFNRQFQPWLSECYQHKAHSALPHETSPVTAYRSDPHPIRFALPEDITIAFLHAEERKVDKSGCISFMSRKYEVGLAFIGTRVNVVYDPADITELTIEATGHTPFRVKELVIGEYAGKRPELPRTLTPEPTKHSRLLAAAKQQQQARRQASMPAVSYRSAKGDDRHV